MSHYEERKKREQAILNAKHKCVDEFWHNLLNMGISKANTMRIFFNESDFGENFDRARELDD